MGPRPFRRTMRRTMRRVLLHGLTRLVAGAGVVALLAGAAWIGAPPLLAAQGEKEVIAVLDLEAAGASDVEAAGLSDKLREELLRTGTFTLADRNNIEAALQELALQQTGCTTQECALQVGRFLGVRKMVVGKVTKFNDNLWQVSGLLLDVETTQTIRAESVIHEGNLISLLRTGMTDLARKLAATPEAAQADATAQAAPLDAEAIKRKCEEEVKFMLNPKHERFGLGLLLSTTSQEYGLPVLSTVMSTERNQCEKKLALAPGTWERVRFVAQVHERLGEDFARGGGPTTESLAALLGCSPQAAPLLAASGRRHIERVLLAPDDDALRYLLRVEAELARTPEHPAACARLPAAASEPSAESSPATLDS